MSQTEDNWHQINASTAWCNEAVTLLMQRDIAGARVALARATKFGHRDPRIPVVEALTRLEAGEPALESATRAVMQNPRDPIAHWAHSWALVSEPGPGTRERWAAAERASRMAVSLAPDFPALLRLNAHLMLQIGSPVVAGEWFNRALELDPDRAAAEYMVETMGPGSLGVDQLLATWAHHWGRPPSERERRAAVEHRVSSELAIPTGLVAWLALIAGLMFNRWAQGWPRWVTVALAGGVLLMGLRGMAVVVPGRDDPDRDALVRGARRPVVVLALLIWVAAVAAVVRSMFGPADGAAVWMMAAMVVSGLAWLLLRAIDLRNLRILGLRVGPVVPAAIWTYLTVMSGILAVLLGAIGLTTPTTQPGAATQTQVLVVAGALVVVCVFCLVMRLRQNSGERAQSPRSGSAGEQRNAD